MSGVPNLSGFHNPVQANPADLAGSAIPKAEDRPATSAGGTANEAARDLNGVTARPEGPTFDPVAPGPGFPPPAQRMPVMPGDNPPQPMPVMPGDGPTPLPVTPPPAQPL